MPDIQHSFEKPGARLYICSTPIGNLQDTSLRLLDTLRTADVIAAEDTRHTRKLLAFFDIHPTVLISYHQHNRRSREASFVRWWAEGKTIALVTDAGTPGVSDPGDDAVSLAIAHDIPVVPVPGASAVLAALVASGLPSLPFTCVGFLPRDARANRRLLDELKSAPGSIVIYESPHRLTATLRQLATAFPGRKAALAKELTKRHETFIRGEIGTLVDFAEMNPAKGEYVIVLGSRTSSEADEQTSTPDGELSEANRLSAAIELAKEAMEQGMSHREAVKWAAAKVEARRADVYRATLDAD